MRPKIKSDGTTLSPSERQQRYNAQGVRVSAVLRSSEAVEALATLRAAVPARSITEILEAAVVREAQALPAPSSDAPSAPRRHRP